MVVLLTINVNGLKDDKRLLCKQWLTRHNPDIVCFQEIHSCSEDNLKQLFSNMGYSVRCSVGTNRSAGVAILFKSAFSPTSVTRGDNGRFIHIDFSSLGIKFRVLCLYAPNHKAPRDTFLNDLSSIIDCNFPTFLCGDFNSVFDPTMDRLNPPATNRPFHNESVVALNSLIAQGHLFDTWRHFNPNLKSFTWYRSDLSAASRIDMILSPSVWQHCILSSYILPHSLSDHCSVVVHFNLPNPIPRGPGLWKLNTSVLEEEDYRLLITNFWSDWSLQKANFSSPLKWWDLGKVKIRQLTIKYCKDRAKRARVNFDALDSTLSRLKTIIDNGDSSKLNEYNEVKSKLSNILLEQARGAQVRSRVQFIEQGETSSTFFFNAEKRRSASRLISAMRTSDGSITHDINGILDSWHSFYQSLYTSEGVDFDKQTEMLEHINMTLSSEESQSCEGPLTPEECLLALEGMSKNKTPGNDGLPAEFYLSFWSILGSDLISVLNYGLEGRLLSTSQRRSVISVLFKKGDRLDHANWRPISLLNVDYKIASRAISGRLLKVLNSVISPDQTCGVPGRFIGENVMLMRDLVDYAETNNLPVAILSLDQEKAFDRVDWLFLHTPLLIGSPLFTLLLRALLTLTGF